MTVYRAGFQQVDVLIRAITDAEAESLAGALHSWGFNDVRR